MANSNSSGCSVNLILKKRTLMDLKLHFNFRNKIYSCVAYIDNSAFPCYVFLDLLDNELVTEFGSEISIKTDFENLLPKKDDYPSLVLLRQAILSSFMQLPDYSNIKQQCRQNKMLAYKQA